MKPSVVVVLAALFASQASARTWHILNDGSGDAPTVQAGIDSSAVGDTVLVGPGTYLENINFSGKDIVLESEMGPDATIIDGSGTPGPVVIFQNSETNAAIIEGFTITGGTPVPANGGGIYCRGASPVIRSNQIVGNAGNDAGGITVVGGSSPLIEQNTLEDNYAGNLGGAIEVFHAHAVIRDNRIIENGAHDDGGGISAIVSSGEVVITGNLFVGNTAGDKGGGVYVATTNISTFVVENNVFVRNEAKLRIVNQSGAGGGVYTENARGTLKYNTFVGNVSRDYVDCGGGGITLSQNIGTLEVAYNIVASSVDCGIVCLILGSTKIGPNLLWNNEGGDLGSGDRACPESWQDLMIIADPWFCNASAGDYTVAENSPAFSGVEPMGAFPDPGCGPVPVKRTTWGRIKAKYGSGP